MTRLLIMFTVLVGVVSTSCTTTPVAVAVRPEFEGYDRVVILSRLAREEEELLIPIYMSTFPDQILVERRDIQSVIGEQDILPDRLDEATRARIRKILGVEAIIFPNYVGNQLFLKVIDTETGVISASVVVRGTNYWDENQRVPNVSMFKKAVATLKNKTPFPRR